MLAQATPNKEGSLECYFKKSEKKEFSTISDIGKHFPTGSMQNHSISDDDMRDELNGIISVRDQVKLNRKDHAKSFFLQSTSNH
jgi:hypothetical protein